jgi:integrase
MASLHDGVIKRGRSWSYVIRVTDPLTGVSRPRWVGGHATEAEAKAARDKARQRARRGEYVDRSSITVEEYLSSWLVAHSLEVKPKTFAGYRFLVDHYVLPRVGRMKLQSVRPMHISSLYRELLDGGGRNGRPLSRRTIDAVHRVLRKAFNDAVVSDQVLESNPVVRLKRPKGSAGEVGLIWTPAELGRFLDHAKSHRLYAFFHVAAFTGARRQLLTLCWTDLDLVAGVVTIRGSTSVVDRQRIVGTTKGGRIRRVSIDPLRVRVLQGHKARQAQDQLMVGSDWPDSDLVFRTGLGEPIYPDTPSQLMPKLIASYNKAHLEAPLPPARLHDLRHIHATTLLLAHEPVHVVAARLGHADPSVTLRVYAHVIHEQAAAVAGTFPRVLEEAARAPQTGPVSTGVSKVPASDINAGGQVVVD